MHTKVWTGIALATLSLTITGLKAAPETESSLVESATSPNPSQAKAAIAALRAEGPRGLQSLMAAYAGEIARHAKTPEAAGDASWQRLATAIDAIGAQKDDWASGLFWHTDLEEAKAAARASGKPILSLRLLGKLDEELSCANSRFFRTALYPNVRIGQYLREHFILHWQSVRPVPKVTIDFGDGRVIQTTTTGNSIHYVLDAQGRPLDALPGMYGPAPFEQWLQTCDQLAANLAPLNDAERSKALQAFHRTQLEALTSNWQSDFKTISTADPTVPAGLTLANLRLAQLGSGAAQGNPPSAGRANRIAMSKAVITPNVNLGPTGATNASILESAVASALWAKMAGLPEHQSAALLDAGGLAVLRSKFPLMTGRVVPVSMQTNMAASIRWQGIARNFERLVAEDSVRNEYLRHSFIHEWLAQNPTPDLQAFNDRVYATLFLTPGSDPWLGLLPTGDYAGLPNNGVIGASPFLAFPAVSPVAAPGFAPAQAAQAPALRLGATQSAAPISTQRAGG